MDGFLLINKPQNMTSYDVIRDVKKKLEYKKIGHSGTLDPMTDGILVLALGKATKYLPILSEQKEKVYEAEMKFGLLTDTADIHGEVLEKQEVKVSLEELQNAIDEFPKEYDQYPPIYSAKKVNGKRLYEYARENKEVEIKPAQVQIKEIKILEAVSDDTFKIRCVVSKGTYIRSLINDIAQNMGTIATMSKLTRTATDGFTLAQTINLDEVEKDKIFKLSDFLCAKYPIFYVKDKIEVMVKNGVELKRLDNQTYPLLYKSLETGKLLALYGEKDSERSKPILMLGEL